MNTILACSVCARKGGAMNASAHKCEACGHDTYSAMKLCGACGLLLDECMFCRANLNLNVDAATLDKVRALVSAHKAEQASVEAEYDETIAPIKDEVERFRADNNAVWEEYQAASNLHEHVVVRPSGGTSLEPKSPEDAEAMQAARTRRDEKMTAVRSRFAPHEPLFEYAQRKQQWARGRGNRRFDLQVEFLVVQALAPRALQEELARVDEQYERSLKTLSDPRKTATAQDAEGPKEDSGN